MRDGIDRYLKVEELLLKKSHFLFGPRQTGKTWLIREQLSRYKSYNLLQAKEFNRLNANPSLLSEEVFEGDEIVVIDEIQKIPKLLDEVHYLIEERGVNFLLTGSSARKLKRGAANLLGARARILNLHPFVSRELGEEFSLEQAMLIGLIPGIYFSDDPEKDLESYIRVYLQEEVAAEGLTRNLSAFGRFLEVAALCHAEEINFSNIASDAQVPRTTVIDYFQILTDTLIAYELKPWKGAKRKTVERAKFYFFDFGLVRKLQGLSEVVPKTPIYGKALESIIFQELRAYTDYHDVSELHYWRTYQKDEVDFIFDNRVGIEVKAKTNVQTSDLKGLAKLKEEGSIEKYYVVSMEQRKRVPRTHPFVTILPYREFLGMLWDGEL
ncbi:MAG: AAA family ATPase [bacterium]|nr:AAA family ATPase [bacterium]